MNHIKLGMTARDTLTGWEGHVIAITEWLNGCRRICIQEPKVRKGGKIIDLWFDEPQVEEMPAAQIIEVAKTGGPRKDPSR